MWSKFLVGGHAHEGSTEFFSSVLEVVPEELVVAIAGEVFVADPRKRSKEDLQMVGGELLKHFSHSVSSLDSCSDFQTCFCNAFKQANIAFEDVGASVCLTAVTKTKVVSANLGNICAFMLQANSRGCRPLSLSHDAFDAQEMERLRVSGVEVVKHGSSLRYIKDMSEVSR